MLQKLFYKFEKDYNSKECENKKFIKKIIINRKYSRGCWSIRYIDIIK